MSTLSQSRLDEIRAKAEEEAKKAFPFQINEMAGTIKAGHKRKGYAAAAYRYMVEAEERERWIPVSERLPEEDQRVLVWIAEPNAEPYASVWRYEAWHPSWKDGTIAKWKPFNPPQP